MTDLPRQARAIFDAALRRVQAPALLGAVPWSTWTRRPLDAYRRVVVVGMGKASMAMAAVVEAQLAERVSEGVVVVPQGYPATFPDALVPPRRIRVREGAHPVPDATSVAAAREILAHAAACEADDLLVVLISGGGTALCADFVEGVSLAAARRTFRLLLESGADIHAMNTVRKHLSRVGGGRLARAAAPAEVLALVVSDVVGDDLSVIASGPAEPDPSTFADAVDVLHGHGLWEAVPAGVRACLEAGWAGERPETPKPGDPLFARVRTERVGSNREALTAAAEAAAAMGLAVRVVTDRCTGEAREVGRMHAQAALAAAEARDVCLLWGGETTVTVRGDGRGGRNQELALAAALALDGAERELLLLSAGTDGIDGPTDAAGAWATSETAAAARRLGLDPPAALARNDAYPFFDRLGALVRTGQTHTNVMDVQVAVARAWRRSR